MSVLEEYLIDGDDLAPEHRDQMGQAVLRAIRPDATRFQADIPQLKPTDPPSVHAAAEILRTAAGKASAEDLKYAMTGWLDATDSRLWDAYVTFMPWSIDGDVWDQEGRQIASVDDGVVSAIAIAPNRVPEPARIVGPERLTPWLEVKAARRAERRRWIIRHPDTLIGGSAVGLGLLLIPLQGPGWPLLAAGAVLLIAGAAVRNTLRR
ncbi:MAG TPA: hypothetical protein VFX33_14085 [Actinomycetales bacterium]|nr:hypothetical protein [Actinomycetales bacterium]